jgi:glucose-6-phosphate 1-dehydrogenase
MVIFGAAGDLTKRKLIPALYNLAQSSLLPKEFAVLGVARAQMSTDDFRQKMSRDIYEFATSSVDAQLWDAFEKHLYYLSGDFQDPDTYEQLQELLATVDQECGTGGNYLYYLATAPNFFNDIVWQLGTSGLVREEEGMWRRVIIEKPFGHDFDSARALNKNISGVLQESQVYRIDHYLGKETVQNIGISLQFGAKVPGPSVRMGTVEMNFAYADYFGTQPSTGYETLLYDCMIGDATLFQRSDNVEISSHQR